MVYRISPLLWYFLNVLTLYLSYNTDVADSFATVPPTSSKLHHKTLECVSPLISRKISTHLYVAENKETEEAVNGLSEEERLQRELDNMLSPPEQESFGFNPDNFDESKLPIPLFTGLVVMAFSLYMTGYFLYVGLNGFPEDDMFPPPF